MGLLLVELDDDDDSEEDVLFEDGMIGAPSESRSIISGSGLV